MMRYEQEHSKKLQYLFSRMFQFRWWAIGVMLGVLVGMCVVLPLENWRLWSLGGLLFAILFVALPRVTRIANTPQALPFFQRFVNAAVLVHLVVVALTGGLDSPFFPILMLTPMLSGVLWRDVKKALPAPLLASIGIPLLALLQWQGIVPGWPNTTSPQVFSLLSRSIVMVFVCWISMYLTASFSALYEEVAAELTEAQEEIIQHHLDRWQSMEHMTRQMAHEVKNPLAAIKGLTQLLQRKGEASGHISVIAQEVERLQATLESYLSMSRPLQPAHFEPVWIEPFLREALRVFEARFAQKDIEVKLEDIPALQLHVAPHRMKQVFFNLWLNTIEAFEQSTTTEPRWLRISGQQQDRGVRLIFQDNGPGFPETERDFMRYLKLHATTKAEGTGLGLTISLAIVEAHGGTLTLHRAVPHGAEIHIWLPLRPPQLQRLP